jgi:hypothetical protein
MYLNPKNGFIEFKVGYTVPLNKKISEANSNQTSII